jgi:hypothetical protein
VVPTVMKVRSCDEKGKSRGSGVERQGPCSLTALASGAR